MLIEEDERKKKAEEYAINIDKQEENQSYYNTQSEAKTDEKVTKENETSSCVKPLYDDKSVVELMCFETY